MLQQKKLKTGTTTVGMVCKDCVILAAESKSTMGWLISSKTAQKIYQIDDKIAMTISGGVGDAQALIRILKAEINIYKLTRHADITVKAATTLLSNILIGSRWYPYMVMPIVGGVDKDGFHIYSIDPVGGMEDDKFISTGSGSPMAYGVMENEYKEGIPREEGIRIAVRAIRSARERDVFSGGRDINVIVIDKDGLRLVDKEKIKEIAK
ncbi:MAG: archaeal proteasome endopeptidase complex subunit beta [Candidatus Aenigmarchaeota archaeon]|nr:archaeal proteasome endopeptidase complex subunit beta [Candidatus Aenigmarchaeota archaeon]